MTSEIQLESATSAGQLQEHEEAVQKAETSKTGDREVQKCLFTAWKKGI
jgi:hypothetical protein